jgi:hypothetical protein
MLVERQPTHTGDQSLTHVCSWTKEDSMCAERPLLVIDSIAERFVSGLTLKSLHCLSLHSNMLQCYLLSDCSFADTDGS